MSSPTRRVGSRTADVRAAALPRRPSGGPDRRHGGNLHSPAQRSRRGVPAGHVTFVSVAPTARRQGLLTRHAAPVRRHGGGWGADRRPVGQRGPHLPAFRLRAWRTPGWPYRSTPARSDLLLDPRTVRSPARGYRGRVAGHDGQDLRPGVRRPQRLVGARGPALGLPVGRSTPRGATGRPALRAVVHESDQGPDGYAVYRARDVERRGPDGEVRDHRDGRHDYRGLRGAVAATCSPSTSPVRRSTGSSRSTSRCCNSWSTSLARLGAGWATRCGCGSWTCPRRSRPPVRDRRRPGARGDRRASSRPTPAAGG